jgi:CRISPR-associated protein Cas6
VGQGPAAGTGAGVTLAFDLAFPVAGDIIGRDYQAALYRALVQRLPWLEEERLAGVHPIRGLTPCPGGMLIGGRTRLVLRVPEHRAEACAALEGAELEIPASLRLGRSSRRELLPYPVLHTRLAITGAQEELAFVNEVRDELVALGIDCDMVVGRRGELKLDADATLAGYSLMLHGLSPADALLAQQRGVGRERKFGCGLFVPHKSVAAVGSRDRA